MENARCTQDNSLYSADQFAGLPRDAFLSRRQNLVCPECERRAFFRGQSQNGRDPHFGARPHAEGCTLKTAQMSANTDSADVDLLDTSKRIVVDFSHGGPALPVQASQAGRNHSSEMTDESEGFSGFGAPTSVRHIRMAPLLRFLMSTPQFQNSPKVVDIPSLGSVRACDFFVQFSDLDVRHMNVIMGVFGKIASVQYVERDKAVWLNSGYPDDPSVCVPVGMAASLLERFEFNDIALFAHTTVLVFGPVRISPRGKRYVLLQNPLYLMVNFAQM